MAVTDGIALAPLIRDRAGIVVPSGDVTAMADALEAILMNPGLATHCGAVGRALVDERFLLAEHVNRTVALYQDISNKLGIFAADDRIAG